MMAFPDLSSLAPSVRLYLRPAALHGGREASALIESGAAFRLAGSRLACSLIEVIPRHDDQRPTCHYAAPPELAAWSERCVGAHAERARTLLERLRDDRGGRSERPQIIGILNVTPDSFSDGGQHAGPGAAVERGARLVEQGADIVDVGGESTRPFAQPVAAEEELRRVLPVVEKLVAAGGEEPS